MFLPHDVLFLGFNFSPGSDIELLLAEVAFSAIVALSAFSPAYYIWVVIPDVRETSLLRRQRGRSVLFDPHKVAMNWFSRILTSH